ncbi:uncharacterized protein SETTUDRAFT_22674 [Exserohilum turcica Et28A]|uniref:Uncharacterized protein n=1 Tax=Exserohilum turcicum (strain 28A) TaxID=671987 RepID=R0K2U9_EXST2|nr:uncharacterized protein SETTUDRAFT_22674 [Exserohilum turcica Et28A]EOA82702.1 hypothetical protein SETTUDRAFT_22674 [Exserohilum turcica Et28A]
MAPDANAVSASSVTSNPSTTQPASGSLSRQTSTPASRRASQIYPMGPPPLPLASPGGTAAPPTQAASQHGHAFPPLSPGHGGYVQTSADAAGVPMRHPRPMTAAELHLELEKEQEAVVNRLTRELSALRAHSASVASTASLSSAADSSVAHVEGLTGPKGNGRRKTEGRKKKNNGWTRRNSSSSGISISISSLRGTRATPLRLAIRITFELAFEIPNTLLQGLVFLLDFLKLGLVLGYLFIARGAEDAGAVAVITLVIGVVC